MNQNLFWRKVKKTDSCWLWIGTLNEDGYGCSYIQNPWNTKFAHRISFGIKNGFVPSEINHKCRIRNCINPDHLEEISHAENVKIGILGKITGERQLSKTHCPQGHEYTPENTYVDPKIYSGNVHRPSRHCKICKLAAHQRWRERQKNGQL